MSVAQTTLMYGDTSTVSRCSLRSVLGLSAVAVEEEPVSLTFP